MPPTVPTLVGHVDVRISDFGRDWIMRHTMHILDRQRRRVATIQVSTMFVPLAREGWLQKLVVSAAHPFGRWTVVWAELLEDGKLSWFDSPRKRKADFRGVLALDHAVAVGLSNRYRGQPNAAAHMEVQARMPRRGGAVGKLETHIFKSNHPDEAGVWMADLQSLWRQQRSEAEMLQAAATPRPMPAVAAPPMLPAIAAPAALFAIEATPPPTVAASDQPTSSRQVAQQQRRRTSDHDIAMFDQENDAMFVKQTAERTVRSGRPPATPRATPRATPGATPRDTQRSTPRATPRALKLPGHAAASRPWSSPLPKLRAPKQPPTVNQEVRAALVPKTYAGRPRVKGAARHQVQRLALAQLTNMQSAPDRPSARQMEAADLMALRPMSHRSHVA